MKVQRNPHTAFPFASGRNVATKLDQASLLGMKIQTELLESLSKCLRAGSCVRLMLKANHEVIRLANPHPSHEAYPKKRRLL